MNHSDKPRALIVDDNPFNRVLLKELLEAEGFSAEEGQNGREAIERIKLSEFRLIFMDLLMPGMDGFETIRRIRSMGITTPIIIVSSMSSKEDRQRCMEAGGNDFLSKPILGGIVGKLVKKYELESPVSVSDTSGIPSEGENQHSQNHVGLKFSDYHVLLVEEEDCLAKQYSDFMENLGLGVSRVSNGDEAWEIFLKNKYKFQIIVSNIFTSGIDGLGILDRIKRDYTNVMVFIYAKDYDQDTFQLAIQLGVDNIIAEADFEASFAEIVESAIYQSRHKGSRRQAASTVRQVRQAQKKLIRYGCPEPCRHIDIAYSPLTHAGGDMACCRRFNLAGRCGIFMGDVSGHNVMSSYISAISLGILSTTWNKNQKARDLMRVINAELNKQDYEHYHLCATVLLWDRHRKKMEITTAGNPGGILIKFPYDAGISEFDELEGGGMCLGLLREEHLFLDQEIAFDEESYFFLFSDGVSSEQIIDVLSSGNIDLSRRSGIRGLSWEILDGILEKYGQNDDVLLISLRSSGKYRDQGLHYDFPSTYEGADRACKWAAVQCAPQRIPAGKDSCFIFLALREALINAVRHGNDFKPDAFVHLSLFFNTGELIMQISDEGPGFELPDPIQGIEAVNVLQPSGRGLSVMYSVADSITVDGGTVSLIFRGNTDDFGSAAIPECKN